MPTEAAGVSDSGDVRVDDGQVAELAASGFTVVEVPDPNDEHGVLFVAAPDGATVDEASALVGAPGPVKGPSERVWGKKHAAAFPYVEPVAEAFTPQGDGEPVKGPSDDYDAAEVIDPPQE